MNLPTLRHTCFADVARNVQGRWPVRGIPFPAAARIDRLWASVMHRPRQSADIEGLVDSIVTDRGDASGTGYYATATDRYRPNLLELAFGTRRPVLPRVAAPNEITGAAERIAPGAVLGPGTGDNAAAALALDGARR